MPRSDSHITRFFDKIIIAHPRIVLACLMAVVVVLGYHAKDFKIDASAETLIQESDDDFRYARQIYKRYGIQDFLVISYAPRNDLFSEKTLSDIARLRDDVKQLAAVESVVTILDIPMLESPPLPIKELANDIPTLESPGIDLGLARQELKNSPIYNNLIVSPDLKTTAILINFKINQEYRDLIDRLYTLEDKASVDGLTDEENAECNRILVQIDMHNKQFDEQRHEDIKTIRSIMDKYRNEADLFLGGISMIADDMIRFVKNDLKLFGFGVFCFLVLTLGVIFKRVCWVVLPLLCCLFSAVAMIGLLGLFNWKVTVISSNFISSQ